MLTRLFLILSLSILASCKDPVPVTTIAVPNFELNYVDVRTISNSCTMAVGPAQEEPLNTVDGWVCIPTKQYAQLIKWIPRQSGCSGK